MASPSNRAAARWKDEAGASILAFDPTGASGTSVGREVDLTWRCAWKEKAGFEAGYARFTPERFARLNRGGDSSSRAYVMLTAGF